VNTFAVGLTGGIGSGKTAVADLFAMRGVTIVDSDAIAHDLTRSGGPAIAAIRAEFGAEVIGADGALDRAAMRKLAFADPGARRRLEAILHPLIRRESDRRAEDSAGPYVILSVPLLVESGVDRSRYARVLVVDCTQDQQIDRVTRRSGLSKEEIRGILSAQASREQRLACADDVIDNTGPPQALDPQVARLHEQYLTLVAGRRMAS
jgi:dephospho-CoA kinase